MLLNVCRQWDLGGCLEDRISSMFYFESNFIADTKKQQAVEGDFSKGSPTLNVA